MFEMTTETTQHLVDKVGMYGVIFIDKDIDAQVMIRANAMPDEMTDLSRVRVNINKAYVNDPWFSTSICFTDELKYWILRDNAELPRSVVTKCIDFALKKIPEHFPNVGLPEGYPTEEY